MHIGRHIVQELVLEFEQPEIERWTVDLSVDELAEVEEHRSKERAHDVSLLIVSGEELVVVRRHGYPDGAFRIPSGAVHPEESFLDGAAREALEQTGLVVSIDDYLLQVHTTFVCEDRSAKWTTHVLQARSSERDLAPRRSSEVESARWMSWHELGETVNPLLDATPAKGLRYRARLHRRLEAIVRDGVSQRAQESSAGT